MRMDWYLRLLISRAYASCDSSCILIVYRFGFSFLGARFTDAKLIGLAYAFEQRTMIRKTVRPYIAPRTDLRNVIETLHE